MSKITYTDKVALNENPSVADINKVRANDLNEIKNVVNANDNNVGDLADLKTTDVSSVVNAINEITQSKGSSANGDYIKFENGILICWGKKSFTNVNIVDYGNGLYRSVSIVFDDFPIAYISQPIVNYTISSLTPNSNSALPGILYTATNTNAGRISIIKNDNQPITGEIGYIAIGKWK